MSNYFFQTNHHSDYLFFRHHSEVNKEKEEKSKKFTEKLFTYKLTIYYVQTMVFHMSNYFFQTNYHSDYLFFRRYSEVNKEKEEKFKNPPNPRMLIVEKNPASN